VLRKGGGGGDIYQRFKQFQHLKMLYCLRHNALHSIIIAWTKNPQPIISTSSFSAIVRICFKQEFKPKYA